MPHGGSGAPSGWRQQLEQLPEFARSPRPCKAPGRGTGMQGVARRHQLPAFHDQALPAHCTENSAGSRPRPRPGQEEMSTSAAAAIRSRFMAFSKNAQACKPKRAYLCETSLPLPMSLPALPACTAGGGCVVLRFLLGGSRRSPSLALLQTLESQPSTAGNSGSPLRPAQRRPASIPAGLGALMTPAARRFPGMPLLAGSSPARRPGWPQHGSDQGSAARPQEGPLPLPAGSRTLLP